MSFQIITNKYEIDNLKDKLNGKTPVNYEDLLFLISSHGSYYELEIVLNENTSMKIAKSEPKECYDLSRLDTSEITDMNNLFKYSMFNGDISNWNTSNVTSMDSLFFTTKNFNSDISKWDVSKVTSMHGMFLNTKNFNQDISSWNVSNVTNMRGMFYSAENFNQDISSWNTSNVEDMSYIFNNSKLFNYNILNWNLNNVLECDNMFDYTKAFLDKYNNGICLPYNTKEIKNWIYLNRDRINMIDLKDKHGKDIDNFFDKFTNINIEVNYIQNKEI